MVCVVHIHPIQLGKTHAVYPIKYAHRFVVLCFGVILL